VRVELAGSGQTSFWVRFEGRPRLAAAAGDRRFVVEWRNVTFGVRRG
jgi:hypothetical protein